MTVDERMYRIACSFRALQFKGVKEGKIPGIGKKRFDAIELAEYLYRAWTEELSDEEILILEFLLNAYNPYVYKEFNIGKAANLLNVESLNAIFAALARISPCRLPGGSNSE